jgi:predicted dehydrogenase
MRFALLGDHPDGLAMARALVETGRHELALYAGPGTGVEYLWRWGLAPSRVADAEEILADASMAAVIVAGSPANRAALLRRAVQSERHVVCVHPPDHRADTAYEAAMIRAETGYLLFPLLPEALHPAIRRIAELLHQAARERAHVSVVQAGGLDTAVTATPPRPSERVLLPEHAEGQGLRLIKMERWATEHVLLDATTPGHKPGLPGWDVLRALGGEIVELSALAAADEVSEKEPVLLSGCFERGALFQAALLPRQAQERWRLTVIASSGAIELDFPEGWPGAARLSYVDAAGVERLESFESWNPWPTLVEALEASLTGKSGARALPAPQRELPSTAVREGVAPLPAPRVSQAATAAPTW